MGDRRGSQSKLDGKEAKTDKAPRSPRGGQHGNTRRGSEMHGGGAAGAQERSAPPALDINNGGARNAALYSTPSVFNIMREDVGDADEPGPGQYFGPESAGYHAIGSQRFSKNRSEPIVSIARTGWKDWSKVYITKGHVSNSYGVGTPGVGTYQKEPGQLSELNTTSGRKVGNGLRPGLEASLGVDPYGSPGPTYDIRTRHHKIMVTTGASESIRFGKADRWADTAPGARLNVGPGQYNRKDTGIRLDAAIGRSFGVGWRAFQKQHQGPGFEKNGFESKGPGPPLWKNIKKDGERAHFMPREKRFRMQELQMSTTPGPGAYDRNERDIAKRSSSVSDTRSPASVSMGKPTRRARLRPRLAALCTNAQWGYF